MPPEGFHKEGSTPRADPARSETPCLRSLVVAVTGHRDIDDSTELRQVIRGFLADLISRFPDLPLVVVSALAEGADQIVARVATESGLELRVVLPMSREIYLNDFETEQGRQQYEQLEARAKHVVILRCDEDDAELLQSERARARAYGRLSEFLAAHSHMLLALWDGEDGGPLGGTHYTVGLKIGSVSLGSPVAEFFGPVECIPVVRGRGRGTTPATYPRYALYPPGSGRRGEEAAYWHGIFESIERHNRVLRDVDPVALSRSLASLVRGRTHGAAVRIDWIACLFARYDALAIALQKYIRFAYAVVFTAAAAAVVFHTLFYDWNGLSGRERLACVLAYYVAVALAYALVYVARTRQWEADQHEYRSLAEALRVRYYWEMCGVSEARLRTRGFRSAGPVWRALFESSLYGRPLSTHAGAAGALRYAIAEWIRPQEAYLQRLIARSRLNHRVLTFVGVGAVMLAGALPLVSALRPEVEAEIASTGILLVGALSMALAEKRGYAENVSRAEDTLRDFSQSLERCERLLERPIDERQIRRELVELGHLAMAENAEWLRLRQERTLSVPASG